MTIKSVVNDQNIAKNLNFLFWILLMNLPYFCSLLIIVINKIIYLAISKIEFINKKVTTQLLK